MPSQAISSYVFPSGVGMGAVPGAFGAPGVPGFAGVPTVSGLTMSGVGMSGIGMSALGLVLRCHSGHVTFGSLQMRNSLFTARLNPMP
jgi:hypothetical protein